MDPTYRTTPDGAGYRLVITQASDHCDNRLERLVDGTWASIQAWSAPCPETMPAASRRLALTETAVGHGWALPADSWKPRRHGVITLTEIHPVDWITITAESSAHRARFLAEFSRLDRAWRGVIDDSLEIGYRSATEVARAAGMTRARIYQIRRENQDKPANPEASIAHAIQQTDPAEQAPQP